MKLAHSISTWIMVGIVVLMIVAVGLISRFAGTEAPKSDWKTDIITENESIKKNIDNPEISENRKANLTKQLQTNEYHLEHNIEPIQGKSLWGFVEGIARGMIGLISLFAIIMAGGIVANEFSGGTI